MRDFFHLDEYGTTRRKEAIAGVTTFFAMAYIIVVAPNILSSSGIPWGAVFIASILASVIGSLVMALYANVPFSLAPGLGMAAFFTVTACATLHFTWQQALSVVFICGLVNCLITVTSLRKKILAAVPESLQVAISGGIGLFLAYMGMLQSGFIVLDGDLPAMASQITPSLAVFFIGLFFAVVFHIRKIRVGIILSIVIASVAAFVLGVTELDSSVSFFEAISQFPETFGAIFTSEGLPALFSDASTAINAAVLIMLFSFVDTFDTIGTFVGAGHQSGVFTKEEMEGITEPGFNTRLDRALIADATGTVFGAMLGTSNTTTVVESMTGISVGGRTGLTTVFTIICLVVCMFFAPVFSLVPTAATAGVLVIVGVMMMSAFHDIEWSDFSEALPAFFASVFMALCFNISYGIAAGFIMYCLVKIIKGEWRQISPIIAGASAFFIAAMILLAVI